MVFLGVCISSLTRYKQGKFAINTHQIYIFIISNCLAALTENVRYIALKSGAHLPISQNIPSSSNVTIIYGSIRHLHHIAHSLLILQRLTTPKGQLWTSLSRKVGHTFITFSGQWLFRWQSLILLRNTTFSLDSHFKIEGTRSISFQR